MIASGGGALTVADLPTNWRLAGQQARGKYGNRKTVVDGITFDSAKEAARWQELRIMEQGGYIKNLRYHTPWLLQVNGVKIGRYTSDFDYINDGIPGVVVEDVKSPASKTEAYGLRKKLMLACHGIAIKET